jgi:hypothetical protein
MITFAEILDEDVPELPEDGKLPRTLLFGVLSDVVLWCIFFYMNVVVVVMCNSISALLV